MFTTFLALVAGAIAVAARRKISGLQEDIEQLRAAIGQLQRRSVDVPAPQPAGAVQTPPPPAPEPIAEVPPPPPVVVETPAPPPLVE